MKKQEKIKSGKGPAKKAPEDSNEGIRLNKYLADAGIASRRKADEMIARGKVKINSKTVSQQGTKVMPGDFVTVNGDPVKLRKNEIYILLNKPKDHITTTSDEFGRKTVMDIVRKHERIYPVGRLDRNTTGVLLMTNDGEMANRLTHPRYQIERVYNVTVDKDIKPEDFKHIARGVDLDDGKTSPAEILAHPEDKKKVTLALIEGKNREVRRIFEALGYYVKKLDRKFFAGLSASGLKRGQYRHLTKKEVFLLKKMTGIR